MLNNNARRYSNYRIMLANDQIPGRPLSREQSRRFLRQYVAQERYFCRVCNTEGNIVPVSECVLQQRRSQGTAIGGNVKMDREDKDRQRAKEGDVYQVDIRFVIGVTEVQAFFLPPAERRISHSETIFYSTYKTIASAQRLPVQLKTLFTRWSKEL